MTVAKYLAMAENGLLLTDDGWHEASKLFLHPSPAPADSIVVVSDKGSLDESWIRGGHAEETAGGYDLLGRIDSTFRLVPAPKSKFYKSAIVYRLVLTDSGGKGEKQWKIENAQGLRWTTVTGALQYLTQKRNTTTDPIMRKHADETLSVLRKYQSMLRDVPPPANN
jgi:hypothetical protein